MRQDEFKKILVIKLRYIGDVLLSTPAVANLRCHFPDAYIAMVVNRGTEEVLRYIPHLNEVIQLDRSRIRGDLFSRIHAQLHYISHIRKKGFDLVVDLTDGDRGAILSYLSGAPVRIGFNADRRIRGRLYTKIVHPTETQMHNVEYQLEAIKALGLPVITKRLELYWSKEEELFVEDWIARKGLTRHPFVTIHPGGRWWFKQWPLDRFAALADILEKFGLKTIFLGGEREKEELKEIQHHLHNPFIGAGDFSLLQMAVLIQRSRCFIGNDNGPMHIAAAVGVPVVALFGSSDPKVWGPLGKGHTILYKGVPCSPCDHIGCDMGDQNCMRQISIPEVFTVVERIVAKER